MHQFIFSKDIACIYSVQEENTPGCFQDFLQLGCTTLPIKCCFNELLHPFTTSVCQSDFSSGSSEKWKDLFFSDVTNVPSSLVAPFPPTWDQSGILTMMTLKLNRVCTSAGLDQSDYR